MSPERIGAITWKEWREIGRLSEGARSLSLRFVLVLGFGVLLSWQLGAAFGHGWNTLGILVELAVFAALPVAPDAFAGERERHTLETLLASPVTPQEVFLGKYLAVVAFAAAFPCLGVLVGLTLVMVRFGAHALVIDPMMIAGGIVLGTLSAAVAAGVVIVISVYSPTARSASQRSAYAFVGLLLATSSLGRSAFTSGWRSRFFRPEVLEHLTRPMAIAAGSVILLLLAAAICGVGVWAFQRRLS